MAKTKEAGEVKVTSKRKAKKQRSAAGAPREIAAPAPDDSMTRCVALCQELRWREALLLARKMEAKAEPGSLSGAFTKIEYSLRRQMAAALGDAAKNLLKKEYLLDVGE